MEVVPEDLWSPFKQLHKVLQQCMMSGNNSLRELEICLKKQKHCFTNLLANPPKNDKNRAALRNSINEGISLGGHGRKLHLSKELVDESIIISDMYNLDEFVALELLCSAQRQMHQHPRLTRGLIAILLYYDGRKTFALTLRDLFQIANGVAWDTELPLETIGLVSGFMNNLLEESNILQRMLDLLDEIDISQESALLTKNRAFGPKKHQNQVLGMLEDIRLALATALFNCAAQRGLPKTIVVRLIHSLGNYRSEEASGLIDDVTLTTLMALMYSYDTSVLQRQEDNNVLVQQLPVMSEPEFAQQIYDAIMSEQFASNNNISSIVKFSFGLSLANLRHAPNSLQTSTWNFIEKDEQLVDEAVSMSLFEYIYHNLLEKDILFKTEFFYRRLHMIFTDFIDFMHSKVTELKGRADETARTTMNFLKEGLEPPQNLDHTFETLMLCIGKFYKDDRPGLALCVEFWGSPDSSSTYSKTTTRSVALYKFIRLAGELLQPTLFVPYLTMIAGLTSCERSARCAFNLLKLSGLTSSSTLSWEHFFGSLNRYYSNLRQERGPGGDSLYRVRSSTRCINPQEIDGLLAVLAVVRSVVKYDEIARVIIADHPTWTPPQCLIGLLSCSIVIELKAEILHTLAALARSRENANTIWNILEASQIIPTLPAISSFTAFSLLEEIEQNECRIEIYTISQGILDLLYALASTSLPRNLGCGERQPGYSPYLTFILNTIFLKFYNRTYKNSSEKWILGAKCLKLFYLLLLKYNATPADFSEDEEESPPPGFHIMLQMHNKSDMLKLILLIIDDSRTQLDEYCKFHGKEEMEECALYCLLMLQCALEKQNIFFDAYATANSSLMVAGLNKILLDVNPRTCQPDYVLNTTKFVTYNTWLPHHTLVAIKILNMVSRFPSVSLQLLRMFDQYESLKLEIRQGFVENLEEDIIDLDSSDSEDDTGGPVAIDQFEMNQTKLEIAIKESILDLFLSCLTQPLPNFMHYLLGFDIQKDAMSNERQIVIDHGSNCTKSLITLLDTHMEEAKYNLKYNEGKEFIIERAFMLLYNLCESRNTSDIMLRYLRTCNDFLCRYLNWLPFKNSSQPPVINQMSYLLKCIAIELKVSAKNNQVSRFQYMCEILVGLERQNSTSLIPAEFSQYCIQPDSLFYNSSVKPSEHVKRVHLCNLLDYISLEYQLPSTPKLDYFDANQTDNVLRECEVTTYNNYKLIDIRQLHHILNEELRTVQSTIATGQRKVILQEIGRLLKYALKVNESKNEKYATMKFIEAWGQTTEILFTCMPDVALPILTKKNYIIEVIQKVLSKITVTQTYFEITIQVSETVLLLLVDLRYCYHQLNEKHTNGGEKFGQTDTFDLNTTSSNNKPPNQFSSLSLKFILKNLLDWILISGVTSQKLRINLYATLLNCLRIIKDSRYEADDYQQDHQIEDNNFYVSRLDRTRTKDVNYKSNFDDVLMTEEVLSSFGDKLVDTFCHDATMGHDICKMLALSCIEMLIELNSVPSLMNFMFSRGYLTRIIEGLLQSDPELCLILADTPENMKPLYVYESKMAMLLCLANNHAGAELLLSEKVLEVLSQMKVFNLHPDIQTRMMCRKNQMGNDFIPSVDERFRQILFPAFNLCDCLISTLSADNVVATSQVMNFMLAHCDMIEFVLRSGTPYLEIGLLKELSAITGIIARTTKMADTTLKKICNKKESKINLFRIQKLMFSICNRFVVNETTMKDMLKQSNVLYDEPESKHGKHIRLFLEISSNFSLYIRNAIKIDFTEHREHKFLIVTNFSEIFKINDDGTDKMGYNLSFVINQLKGSTEYFISQQTASNNLLQQRSSLPNISFDASARKLYKDITKKCIDIRKELSLCAFITEQNLYLLWIHLDHYMRWATTYDATAGAQSTNVQNCCYEDSDEDIYNLKKVIMPLFNDTFCSQLLSTSDIHSGPDRGFNEAILRRIKNLLQFIPTN